MIIGLLLNIIHVILLILLISVIIFYILFCLKFYFLSFLFFYLIIDLDFRLQFLINFFKLYLILKWRINRQNFASSLLTLIITKQEWKSLIITQNFGILSWIWKWTIWLLIRYFISLRFNRFFFNNITLNSFGIENIKKLSGILVFHLIFHIFDGIRMI